MRARHQPEAAERELPASAAPKSEVVEAPTSAGDWTNLLDLQTRAGNAAVGELVQARAAKGPCACGGSGPDCACEGGSGEDHEQRGGETLDVQTRARLESHFGQDLGGVRVHTGPAAAASAGAAGARAYTVGRDIVFAAGAYDPSSAEGQRLLAHEVAHTLQPEAPASPARPVSSPGDPAEVMAARAADALVTGQQATPVGARPAGVVHRQAEGEEGDEPKPLADVSGSGPVTEVQAMATVNLPGQTNASFSSSFVTQGATQRRGEGGCNIASGNLVNTFTVTTSVTLPQVPDGLTECQRANAQRFIDTILAPHEQEHVTAFNTYNGTTTRPFTVTLCPGDDFQALVQAEHDADQSARQTAAQALSDALDPFNVDVDIDAGCEAPAE